MEIKDADPKGLIRESYRIEGISVSECRTIFFDWAVQLPPKDDPADHIRFCLDYYGQGQVAHPMTQVLTQALEPAPVQKRRGGRAGRVNAQGQRLDGRET